MANPDELNSPDNDNPFQAPSAAASDSDRPRQPRGPSEASTLNGCLLFWLFLASIMGAVMVFLVTCFGTGLAFVDSGYGPSSPGLAIAILVGTVLGVGGFVAALIGIGRQMKKRRP